MQFCLRQDIPVFLLSLRGRYYGAISSMANQQVHLHRDQFLRQADPDFSLAVSRGILAGKIANSRALLLRQTRKREDGDIFSQAASAMKAALEKLPGAESVDQLRGLEGAAAAAYFQAFAHLLDPEWKFAGRKRRPPPDPINSLLSYGYTVLFHNVYALVRSRGLHPYVGFYHSLRQGHAALVSDLVEEFRAPIVDATVLSMVHKGQVAPDGFRFSEPEGLPCLLGKETLRVATRAFETAFNRPVSHPDTPGRTDYRRAILLQVERLVEAIRTNRPEYKAFLIR